MVVKDGTITPIKLTDSRAQEKKGKNSHRNVK